ncbi:hypothetical protein T4B_9943 [Trichinella pseudospiralis]|uniref:Uncharacterized protein n=1 Tax=Trichinella pseudospiralis TaxID=6337 RepID=A0A0V1GRE5_TRIPS|nr:hypothetical protein T4B_9943 [Trichinella pseudospiralis]
MRIGNPYSFNQPRTNFSVLQCPSSVSPVKMISSKYAATLAMPANIVSITFWKIASAEGTPEGRLYVVI